ncbi:MAG: cytochrome P460 family protein [Gammaproteobacteria bacterium]|nr:cytochrome P460 family protein [Gammaproteobacteria bacterium]
MKHRFVGILVLISGLSCTAAWAADGKVGYPDGYRDWHHVKSMVIQPGHPLENPFGGMHHVYANKKAVQGLKSGKYPDGAVLVFDLLKYNEGGSALQEGERKLVGVMQRDAKRFKDTGGWGFEGFAGDSHDKRLVSDGGKSCFACHAPEEKSSYVFSKLRD